MKICLNFSYESFRTIRGQKETKISHEFAKIGKWAKLQLAKVTLAYCRKSSNVAKPTEDDCSQTQGVRLGRRSKKNLKAFPKPLGDLHQVHRK